MRNIHTVCCAAMRKSASPPPVSGAAAQPAVPEQAAGSPAGTRTGPAGVAGGRTGGGQDANSWLRSAIAHAGDVAGSLRGNDRYYIDRLLGRVRALSKRVNADGKWNT